MDREYSSQSLPSRGGSVLGSRNLDTGFYMSSFAATIFVGGLVIVGVLLATLLIALTVMLQYCERRNDGATEMSIGNNHDYCRVFALHAELNGLGGDDFPAICKEYVIDLVKRGQYSRDLNLAMQVAEDYFHSVNPLNDGLDMVLVDIDDIFPPNTHYANASFSLLSHRFNQYGSRDFLEKATSMRRSIFLRSYLKLTGIGWHFIFISRWPERRRNATIEYLLSTGYGGWSSLIMRSDDELQLNDSEYFAKRRAMIHEQGYRIEGMISSHMDALIGPFLGKRIFKLPTPIYCDSENFTVESTSLQRGCDDVQWRGSTRK